jgi:hypothetical protein
MMIPLERVNVPWTGWPGTVAAGAPVHVTDTELPALIATGSGNGAEIADTPPAPPAKAQTLVDAGALPVFSRVTAQFDKRAEPEVQLSVVTVTLAVAESVPNSPKANPAIATPATNVMAMRMTVARTGEIAFLLVCVIFIFGLAVCPIFRL